MSCSGVRRRPLEAEVEAAVVGDGESLVGEGWTGHVPAEALQGVPVVRGDADVGVEVEPGVGGAARREAAEGGRPQVAGHGARRRAEGMTTRHRGGEEVGVGLVVAVEEVTVLVEQAPRTEQALDAGPDPADDELHVRGGR